MASKKLVLAKHNPAGAAAPLTRIGFPPLTPPDPLLAEEMTPGGRLSLSSTEPVPITDQAAKTAIFYLPYIHDKIDLWNGSSYKMYTIPGGMSLTPTLAASKVYDVFCYLSGSTPVLELGPAWTNDTTRATDVVWHSNYGRKIKSGDATRRWLGAVATDSSAKLNDYNLYNPSASSCLRTVYNAHNQVARHFGQYLGCGSGFDTNESNHFIDVTKYFEILIADTTVNGFYDAAQYMYFYPKLSTSISYYVSSFIIATKVPAGWPSPADFLDIAAVFSGISGYGGSPNTYSPDSFISTYWFSAASFDPKSTSWFGRNRYYGIQSGKADGSVYYADTSCSGYVVM